MPARIVRAWTALGATALGVAAAFAACGLDESGLLNDASIVDGTVPDAVPDVVVDEAGKDVSGFDVIPLSCEEAGAPLDASCLGVPIPTGWQPIAYRENFNGCNGAANFNALSGVTDASVPPGQCFCSDCQVVGAWSCAATLYTGPTCPSNAATLTATACDNQGGFHFGGTVARSGDAGCAPGSPVDASIAATPVSLCEPTACSADFCGLVAQGFTGCVVNTQTPDAGCPSGFAVLHQVGNGASASCTCPACGVTSSAASCGGTVTAYQLANCAGNAELTQALDGGCINITAGYGSMFYDAGPPPKPTCAPAGPALGAATLNAPTSVCCTQ